MSQPVFIDSLSSWTTELDADPTARLAGTVIQNHGPETALINRAKYLKSAVNVYSDAVTPEGSPIRNQKQSGRCWLFAATNVLRVDIMRRYNLSELELSPSYLFFYDKLEKANFFLNQMEQTAALDVDSRLVQHLLTDPICDGGQYDMFANIVQKYGIVPNHVYRDTFNTLASRNLNRMITTLLRQFGQEIRETMAAGKLATGKNIRDLKVDQLKQIHKLLTVFLGAPPGPTDPIVWEYVDKEKKYHSLETTPLDFYKDVVLVDTAESVSLLHDPRNAYNTVIEVDRLGNVVEKPYVRYLNTTIDMLAQTAIKLIKANKPVFFGTHTPIYHDKKSGIIDTELWDHALVGFSPKQNKADRLRYHESLMTHAMVFTAVHLNETSSSSSSGYDEPAEPVRWKVENSWGAEVGQKGYFIMTHEFFKEYVYQVVAQREELDESLVKVWDDQVVSKVLPPWDPCGALAK